MEKQIRNIIEAALAEDIGTGDITTQATVSRKKNGRARAVDKDDFDIAYFLDLPAFLNLPTPPLR